MNNEKQGWKNVEKIVKTWLKDENMENEKVKNENM